MTRADEMRENAAKASVKAAANRKVKLDPYGEALAECYSQLLQEIRPMAQSGMSSGAIYIGKTLRTPPRDYWSDYDDGIAVGDLFEDKIMGVLKEYHAITLTPLGKRFLKDLESKAQIDGFSITYKLRCNAINYSLGEKIPYKHDATRNPFYWPKICIEFRY